MSIDNPAALLVDVSGSLLSVTASLQIPQGTDGIIAAGVGGDGVVRYHFIDANDALKVSGSVVLSRGGDANTPLFVTGSLTISGSAIQNVTGSVAITQPVTVTLTSSLPVTFAQPIQVTGSVGVSGSVSITNLVSVAGSVGVTGSVAVTNFPIVQQVTGTIVSVPSGVQSVTGSVQVLNQVFVTTTGSLPVTFPQPVQVTGSIAVVNQVTVTGSVGVTGSVSVTNFPAVLTVTGSVLSLPAGVQTITGSVDVTGSIAVTNQIVVNTIVGAVKTYDTGIQAISGTVAVYTHGAQFITGSVTANQGSAAAISGSWPVELTDGITGPAAIKNSGSPATSADKALTVTISPNSAALTFTYTPPGAYTGVSFGTKTLGGGTSGILQAMRSTPYTPPTSGAQRSIASTSASDSSGGIGTRTIKIVYFTPTGAGPYNEIVTMNGTTAVNTVATDIKFIESIQSVTVGSATTNVGTINLYTTTGGGGSVIGSIGIGTLVAAVGDGQTFWAHHYIPIGKTAEMSVLIVGIQSGGSATSGRFFVKVSQPLDADSSENIIGDALLAIGTFERAFTFNPSIIGFSLLTAYAIPSVNNCIVSAAFDWSEVDS